MLRPRWWPISGTKTMQECIFGRSSFSLTEKELKSVGRVNVVARRPTGPIRLNDNRGRIQAVPAGDVRDETRRRPLRARVVGAETAFGGASASKKASKLRMRRRWHRNWTRTDKNGLITHPSQPPTESPLLLSRSLNRRVQPSRFRTGGL